MKIRIEFEGSSYDPNDDLPFRSHRGWAVGAAIDADVVPQHWAGPADTPNRLILGDLDEALLFAKTLADSNDPAAREVVVCPIEDITGTEGVPVPKAL